MTHKQKTRIIIFQLNYTRTRTPNFLIHATCETYTYISLIRNMHDEVYLFVNNFHLLSLENDLEWESFAVFPLKIAYDFTFNAGRAKKGNEKWKYDV